LAIEESTRQHRLHLLLEAEGRPGLFPLLQEAAGAVLVDRFRVEPLLAVGRQSFLFSGTDLASGRQVVIKQPALDYRTPIAHTTESVAAARQPLRVEYRVLQVSTTGHFPQPIALFTATSPVPAARETPLLAENELFLVEERICGATLTHVALRQWPALAPAVREAAARRVALGFVSFWEALCSAGWYYADVSADNLLVEEGSGRLRVVDGGSAVPAGPAVLLTGYTPAFTTPRILQALSRGQAVAGDLATVLPRLAKVLHFSLTRSEPFNGALSDLDDPALGAYSAECRKTLAALLALDAHPENLSAARQTLLDWAGGRSL
jgi:hypothetical protein